MVFTNFGVYRQSTEYGCSATINMRSGMNERLVNYYDYQINGDMWRIGSHDGGICMAVPLRAGSAMEKLCRRLRSCALKECQTALTDRLADEIKEFLNGGRRSFDVEITLIGTEFEQRVWEELHKVGYGERVSYGELARRCGLPMGARAVGGAVGRNPLLLVVPCHRVVAADGSIGGFSAGTDLKRKLLALENKMTEDVSEPKI